MARDLDGKIAIVTGSTSGIGQGIAETLAEAGAHIMLNGFGDAAMIEALQKDMAHKFSIKIEYSPANMAEPAAIRQMVADTKDKLGSVDILVNNAGIQFTSPVEDFPDEKWEEILRINLSAAFYAIKAAVPLMKAKKWGRIINIASAHGLVASGQKAAYVAAKHGLVGLTKVVAIETANDGITANAICPGWVYTPLVAKQVEAMAASKKISVADAKKELLEEKQPMLQYSTPEHLGKLALFLSSDAAATMTGAALAMDGGWTAE